MIDERVEYLEYLYALDEDEINFEGVPHYKVDENCIGSYKPALILKRGLPVTPWKFLRLMDADSFVISYQRELYFYLDNKAVIVEDLLLLSEELEKIYRVLNQSGRCFDVSNDRCEYSQGQFKFRGLPELLKKIKKILEVV